MDMVTTKEALKMLEKRGFSVPYPTLALWVREGRFEGAKLDENNPRGSVWYIPRNSVETFQPPERGRPPKPSNTEKTATRKPGASNGAATGKKKASKR
jgi:hypothetical protein